MNDGLSGETKRPEEQWTAARGVMTTVGTVIIDTMKVSIIVAVAVKASKPWGRCSRGKRLEKPAYAEPEPRNGLSAARMAARDITKGCEGTGREAREGSISKGECE